MRIVSISNLRYVLKMKSINGMPPNAPQQQKEITTTMHQQGYINHPKSLNKPV